MKSSSSKNRYRKISDEEWAIRKAATKERTKAPACQSCNSSKNVGPPKVSFPPHLIA